ncbi:MAG: YfcE family phosphodiesterase [Dehalococcoidia bacterium]|nr:YfcE family phosphodiesterase [Dehalococcoidia bacterium]
MKIGVISDTHVQTMEDIPWSILNALEDVDLIIHAGDFTERAVFEGFRELGEVKAVYGNMDSGELKRMLPDKRTIDVAGRQIGLFHGSGGPWGMAERVRPLFGDIDVIIFGHSHLSFNEYIRGTLMFNPGRARDSFGILTIEKEIEAEIVRV